MPLTERSRKPQVVWHRTRLDGDDLGQVPKRTAGCPHLVPHPGVGKRRRVPRELEPGTLSLSDGATLRESLHTEKAVKGRPRSSTRSTRSVEPSRCFAIGQCGASAGARTGPSWTETSIVGAAGRCSSRTGSSTSRPRLTCSRAQYGTGAAAREVRVVSTRSLSSSTWSRRTASSPKPRQRSEVEHSSASSTSHGSCEAVPRKPCRAPSTSQPLPGLGRQTCQPARQPSIHLHVVDGTDLAVGASERETAE